MTRTPTEIARRNRLISTRAGLVRRIARSIFAGIYERPDASLEDLEGYGTIGLLEAAERWDPAQGVRFSAYAYLRIRGAIYDALRRSYALDWRLIQRCNEIAPTRARLEQRLGRSPTRREVADALGISPDALAELEAAWRLDAYLVSLDDVRRAPDEYDAPTHVEPVDSAADPALIFQRTEELGEIHAAVSRLPERHRLVLALHYGEGLSYRVIGSRLAISHQRVDQIHRAALAALRADLTESPCLS